MSVAAIGWITLGAGLGVLLSGIWWWDHGYRHGYRDGADDTNAMIYGGNDVTGG